MAALAQHPWGSGLLSQLHCAGPRAPSLDPWVGEQEQRPPLGLSFSPGSYRVLGWALCL